jgi:hypothetical protein
MSSIDGRSFVASPSRLNSPAAAAKSKRVKSLAMPSRKSLTSLLGLLVAHSNKASSSGGVVADNDSPLPTETPRTSLRRATRSGGSDARAMTLDGSDDIESDSDSRISLSREIVSPCSFGQRALAGDGVMVFSPTLLESIQLLEDKVHRMDLD